MKTIDIEIAMLKYLDFTSDIVVTNISGAFGILEFETDILHLSKSGYASGFEIKVSKSDLLADKKKKHRTVFSEWFHQCVSRWYPKIKYFNIVVPEDLLDDAVANVPEFWGILTVTERKVLDISRFVVKQVRKPKLLSKYKWSDEERYNLARLGTMRIFSLKKRIRSLEYEQQR